MERINLERKPSNQWVDEDVVFKKAEKIEKEYNRALGSDFDGKAVRQLGARALVAD